MWLNASRTIPEVNKWTFNWRINAWNWQLICIFLHKHHPRLALRNPSGERVIICRSLECSWSLSSISQEIGEKKGKKGFLSPAALPGSSSCVWLCRRPLEASTSTISIETNHYEERDGRRRSNVDAFQWTWHAITLTDAARRSASACAVLYVQTVSGFEKTLTWRI